VDDGVRFGFRSSGAAVMSAYDAAAPSFDRHRALPDGVAESIRAAVLAVAGGAPRPRLLDVGAGAGRIGWPFVAAGDDYVGVDLSFGMLRAFLQRAACGAPQGSALRLVRADGRYLPFADAAFDAVIMIQVFGGMRGWRPLVTEARRVLRPSGALVVGRTLAPEDGVDARMKQRLASILFDIGVDPGNNVRAEAEEALRSAARSSESVLVTSWRADRTPREFLARHRTGARFSALPDPVKEEALRQLGDWAAETFGSLDSVFFESRAFELSVFKFEQGATL
jgi:ubiquinone/menaquinone biosynthesis C-methylase UbiE